MTLRGYSRGKLHASQEGLPRSSPDGSRGSLAGRLDRVSGGQRQLLGGHQAYVHLDQMVLVMAKRGGWTNE
jgi:hypothetical protein